MRVNWACYLANGLPLVSVVVIALMAVLAGAGGPTAIAKWAIMNEEFLVTVLSLPKRIPRKDVFRRVLMTLKPGALQGCFVKYLQSLRAKAVVTTGVTQPVLAIDGKRLRQSHDRGNGLRALHSVSIWASKLGLSLGQVACDEKSNEITAIPEVLRWVAIKGAIITIDDMGTQKAIAAQIIESQADYVLALKGNRETLHQGIIDYLVEQGKNGFADVDAHTHHTEETGHGREERRTYIQMPVPHELLGVKLWTDLRSMRMVMVECVGDSKETVEIRDYIISLAVSVKRFAHAVRSHWDIENSYHWSLDVTYREDESRVRDKHLREDSAWFNRFTLSLLKQHSGRDSVVMKRRSCGWNYSFLLQVLTGATI